MVFKFPASLEQLRQTASGDKAEASSLSTFTYACIHYWFVITHSHLSSAQAHWSYGLWIQAPIEKALCGEGGVWQRRPQNHLLFCHQGGRRAVLPAHYAAQRCLTGWHPDYHRRMRWGSKYTARTQLVTGIGIYVLSC